MAYGYCEHQRSDKMGEKTEINNGLLEILLPNLDE